MKRHHHAGYTLLDVMMANATAPMAPAKYSTQLIQMWDALAAIEKSPEPTRDHWRVCSDAINLMETLHVMGHIADPDGNVPTAVQAMAEAGIRHASTGQVIRLSGPGITAVRIILEGYVQTLAHLPERTIIAAHRVTEHRIRAINRGQRKAHDVQVVAL